jgi:hypothetical protein
MLNIVLIPSIGQPKVNAIEVHVLGAAAAPVGEPEAAPGTDDADIVTFGGG